MRKKSILISLIVLLVLSMAIKSTADVSDQLKQAQMFRGNRQYSQAEKLYLQIVAENPGSDAALEAQKQLILIYIATENKPQADAAFQQLIAGFSQYKDIAEAIWRVAREYNTTGNKDKAIEIHQYNVSNFTKNMYAMWSQVEIVKSYIQDDNAAADEATDELINTFSEQPTLPKEIYQLAERFGEAGKKDRAIKLDKFNAENFPSNIYGMWSQVNYLVRNSDYTAADAAIDKILNDFPDDPATQQGVYQLTGVFRKTRRYDKAIALYKYHIEHWPDAEEGLEVRKGLIRTYIDLNDETNAQAAIDKMLADYSGHARIAKAVYDIGLYYYRANKNDNALKLHRYNVGHCSKTDKYTMWSQVELTKAHIRDGNEPAANSAYDKLVNEFSNQSTLVTEVCRVADTYLAAGNHDKASQLYQYTRNRWPGDSQLLWANAGMAKLDIARSSDTEAQQVIDNLFSSSKDNPESSTVMFQVGEQYWEKALYKRRNGMKDEAKEDLAKALAIWERTIKELPRSSSTSHAYHFAAECHYHLGQYEKAAEYLQKVVNDWPDYEYGWSTYNFLGACYDKLKNSGKIAESQADPLIEQAYKAIIENYPDSRMAGHACLKLARLNSRKKRWSEAAGYYGAFINKYPEDKRCKYVLYDLGRTYEKMGKLENATQVYQLIVQQGDPEDSRVKNSMRRLARIKGEER
ncbi:MAG: tetratricopeptide repeat protein [Phycisphaerales bacterium]